LQALGSENKKPGIF